MKNIKFLIFSLSIILSIFYTTYAFAAGSGAFRLEVPDAGPGGMGSAFVAQADRPSAVYYNPAGLTQLEGTQTSIGLAVIAPETKHESTAGVESKMNFTEFFVPHGYVTTDLGTERFALGLGFLSQFGLGTEWVDNSFASYVATKSELTNYDVLITGAYQLNDEWSFGVGFNYVSSYVNKQRRQDVDFINTALGVPTAGATDGNFQLKGNDHFAGGYILSAHYQPNERHSFGITYRSEIEVEYEGTLSLEGLSGVSSVVFGTDYGTPITSELDLPRSILLGYAYRPNDRWVFEIDFEWMNWSSVEEELVKYPEETGATRLAVLNAGNPAARDWDDGYAIAVGAEYMATEKLALRTGYYYHSEVIPEIHFEPSIPDAESHGITVGFGYDLTQNMTFDFAYHALIYEGRDVDNDKGSANGISIDGEYETFTNILMGTLTYKF